MARRPVFALLSHPATACPAVESIAVQATFTSAGALVLAYSLQADLGRLAIPAIAPAEPADRLWEHTCFEAFVGLVNSRSYREFNFSPSGQWALYSFSGYRQRDEALQPPMGVPKITVRRVADRLELDAVLDPALLPAGAAGASLQIGLTTVIEDAGGSRSYWALAHPATQPDFHHRGGFTLTLPVPGRRT